MRDQLNLINLNKNEIKQAQQVLIRAGLDPNLPDDKCSCLCAPKTDRGWQTIYADNN